MRFSSEYQPANRGRKPGSLNKVNQLLREAAPDVIQAVIEQAREGDIPAVSLVLARTAAPLKAAASPIELSGPIESMGAEFEIYNDEGDMLGLSDKGLNFLAQGHENEDGYAEVYSEDASEEFIYDVQEEWNLNFWKDK